MILISFGTRPEYIKIKPLLKFLNKRDYKLIFTGQHVDLLSDIEESVQRIQIASGPNRLDSIVSSLMNLNNVFDDVNYTLVQGDTTSAFAMALASFHRKIKIIHLEAGLRTYKKERPYPEEFNRQAISRMADIHLCPTQLNKSNLIGERVSGDIFVVGNTVLDNLVDIKPYYGAHVVVTMHRRENHDNMSKWFRAIDILAHDNPDLNFVLPIHPNPNVRKHKYLLKHVNIVEPLCYNEFIKLLSTCKFAITDSGGLQEECSFLKKKCLVCRQETERIESLGFFSLLCRTPEDLKKNFNRIKDDYVVDIKSPYGDGFASEKIYGILKNEI